MGRCFISQISLLTSCRTKRSILVVTANWLIGERVVWCLVWCGVWCGVWCRVVWYGVVWYDVLCCVVRCVVWCGMVWCGVVYVPSVAVRISYDVYCIYVLQEVSYKLGRTFLMRLLQTGQPLQINENLLSSCSVTVINGTRRGLVPYVVTVFHSLFRAVREARLKFVNGYLRGMHVEAVDCTVVLCSC